MPSRPSSFLEAIPESLLEKRNTVKVRSSGRAFMRASSYGYGRDERRRSRGAFDFAAGDGFDGEFPLSPARRRPGTPVRRDQSFTPENESQDAPVIAVGARVRHRKFGAGTIAELTGSGRETKVKVDFDDETIGRKTLVVAQAHLEREIGA
jgi:DNA helicase-2/ATP-dependent DNA helicase PcrA